jgi:hypothetical protein
MRHRYLWSGFPGQPGFTYLYGADAGNPGDFALQTRAFLLDITKVASDGDSLPSGLKIQGDAFVDLIDEQTGHMMSASPVTAPLVITGAGSGSYAGPCGIAVTWITNGFEGDPPRRVRGRTFLVPLAGNVHDSDGTVGSSFLTQARTAASTYLAGAITPVVWHRPTSPGGSDGSLHPIVSSQITDKQAVLRSRRD